VRKKHRLAEIIPFRAKVIGNDLVICHEGKYHNNSIQRSKFLITFLFGLKYRINKT